VKIQAIIKSTAIIILWAALLPAADVSVTAQAMPVTKAAEPVKTPAIDLKPEIERLKAEISSLKERLAVAEKDIKEASAGAADISDSLKALKESSAEIRSVMAKNDELEARLKAEEIKLENSRQLLEKLSAEFSGVKDELSGKLSKMQSWDDIIGVIKKSMTNNEREIAGLKKEINNLKGDAKSDNNLLDSAARWPYLGLTALLVSIAAFAAALSR